MAGLPERLPPGTHRRVTNELTVAAANALALGWAYGSYRFDIYKSAPKPGVARARLVTPLAVDHVRVLQIAGATALARDLVNTPASDMTPERLAAEAIRIAREHGGVAAGNHGRRAAARFSRHPRRGAGFARAPRVWSTSPGAIRRIRK